MIFNPSYYLALTIILRILCQCILVILGGSVALKIPGFVEEVESLVKTKVYPVVEPLVKVRKSTLNEDSGLLGAACLAFNS